MSKKKKELSQAERREIKERSIKEGKEKYAKSQAQKNANINDITPPTPDKIPAIYEIEGYKARPFSPALRLIFGTWLTLETVTKKDSKGEDILDENGNSIVIEEPGQIEQLTVLTYLIFTNDVKEIYKLSRNVKNLSKIAFDWCDKFENLEIYNQLTEYITGLVSGFADDINEDEGEEKKTGVDGSSQ